MEHLRAAVLGQVKDPDVGGGDGGVEREADVELADFGIHPLLAKLADDPPLGQGVLGEEQPDCHDQQQDEQAKRPAE